MAYLSNKYPSNAITTATSIVLVGPIDVTHWDSFCMQFVNKNTAIGFLNFELQATVHRIGSSTSTVDQFVEINTGTIPTPSALGATAVHLTSAIFNCYRTIRIIGHTSSTASAGSFDLLIGGHRRY